MQNESFNPSEHPHRRLNILTNEWVLCSPHRTKRPWQGKVEKNENAGRPQYDPGDYLGPGNKRVSGDINPDYKNTYVFQNDFGALQAGIPEGEINERDLLVAKSEEGLCRVVCFHPRLDLTLPEMEVGDVVEVVKTWAAEFNELAAMPEINYVTIFENKGEIMGCSNPHPHGQIWAQKSVPGEPAKESVQLKRHFDQYHRSLLADYLELELEKQERIVLENDHFVALVPFWAVWPYETMILSKRHFQDITQMGEAEQEAFAEILKHLSTKYDNLFEISFPYSAGIHQRPTDGEEHAGWHFHMHFYPPLLRSATVKKFMVGYEMLGDPQRDITPEYSTKVLRELPNKHYSLK